MAYRLKLNAPLAQEVRRIAVEQIEIARGALAHCDDRDAAVHDARRSLKRLRALLRLIRPALGEAWFKESNLLLAGVAKQLSHSRDLHVMALTVTRLESGADGLPKAVGARLRECIDKMQGAAIEASTTGPGRDVPKALQRAESLFSKRRLQGLDIQDIAQGLEQSYRKARRAFHEAYDTSHDEAFHTWRKATQIHWRHMQLLTRSWPETIGARAVEAKELSRLLGEDHDLSILLAFAHDADACKLSTDELRALTSSSKFVQVSLREIAKPHGERLFADRPGQLTKRISCYWTAAKALSAMLPSGGTASEQKKLPAAAHRGAAQAGHIKSRARPGKPLVRRRSRETRPD